MLRPDGLYYVFIHRSFQEYFTAFAMTKVFPAKLGILMNDLADRLTDNVLLLATEMNKDLVLEDYIRPLVNRIESGGYFKNLKQLELLERVELTYFFSLDTRDRSIMATTARLDLKDEVRQFLNITGMLTGDRNPKHRASFVHDILFGNDIIELFGTDDFEEADHRLTVEIAFRGGVPVVVSGTAAPSAEKDPAPVPLSAKQARDLARRLSVAVFADIEKKLLSRMRRGREWCRKELADSAHRSTSLDSILGLQTP